MSCPHLVTKVWICQTTLDYGPKSQQDALFSDFIPKITAVIPMLCQKNVLSRQTNCPYVVKNVFFFKNTALSYHFFNFSWKTHYCRAHIWSKTREFCQNYIGLWTKKVNTMPFFPIFYQKSLLSFQCFVKTSIFGKQAALVPIFCQKTSFFSKTRRSHVIFF